MGGPQVLQMAAKQIEALEKSASDLFRTLEQVAPQLLPLMKPIAEAGSAVKKELMDVAKRAGTGGKPPQMPNAPPANPAEGPAAGSVG